MSYNSVLSALRYAGQWACASYLLQEMCTISLEADAESFGAAIGACEASAAWFNALRLLHGIHSAGLKFEGVCLASAIGSCERAGRLSDVARLISGLNLRTKEWCCNSDLGVGARLGFSEHLRTANVLHGLDSLSAFPERALYHRMPKSDMIISTRWDTFCDLGQGLKFHQAQEPV